MTNAYLPAIGAIAAVLGSLIAAPAAAADSGAQARYRQEMAVCNSGRSNQDAATCRQEARSALAEARRGRLDDKHGQYGRNARERCGVLKGDNRVDCEARMRGEGGASGSVSGGGILRETVTNVPVK